LPTYKILKANQDKYQVYLRKKLPAKWHYSKKWDRWGRVGDIVIVSKAPYVFNIYNKKVSTGWHGFDPTITKEMGAVFYADGPQLKNNISIPAFDNIHVYPVVAKILGLQYQHKINGKLRVLKNILEQKPEAE
jgi:hypothetical protein